jgi:hypothetical protein
MYSEFVFENTKTPEMIGTECSHADFGLPCGLPARVAMHDAEKSGIEAWLRKYHRKCDVGYRREKPKDSGTLH